MRRRRSYDPSTIQTARMSQADVGDCLDALGNLMTFRDHTLKFECTWSHDEIFTSLIPPGVDNAIRQLIELSPEWSTALNYDQSPLVFLIDGTRELVTQHWAKHDNLSQLDEVTQMCLRLPEKRPCPRLKWTDSIVMLPTHPMWVPIVSYARQLRQLDADAHFVTDSAGAILKACNTWGQVRRLWPELFTFLPKNVGKARIVENQKIQSRLPVMDEELTASLAQKRERTNLLLTQAVLLKTKGKPPARAEVTNLNDKYK